MRTRNTMDNLIAMKKRILSACINRQMKCGSGAKLLQMHPKSFSRLKARYERDGEAVLVPKKTGPKRFKPKNRTSEAVVDLVKRLAINHPDLGPVPLAEKLFDIYQIKMNQTTVWRILKREKVRYYLEYRRWKEEPKFYCLDTPGLELQMDGC